MEQMEIDEGTNYVGYNDAKEMVRDNTKPAGVIEVNIHDAAGYIAAEDIIARIDNPTNDISLKDGYAVKSADVASASNENPVRLRVIGDSFAGHVFTGTVEPGTAVNICSGSPIPRGAEAVVAIEFCDEEPPEVLAKADAEPGRNILSAGGDIKADSVIVKQGSVLLPALTGLVAAAGIHTVKVYSKPEVAIIAIGDEVVAPGKELNPGQLYASNMVTIGAWLSSFGVPFRTSIAGDNRDSISKEILRQLQDVDAIVTSGGAWSSERDLIATVLDDLGWVKLFHHVRMGPGKGIVFGLLKGKPVFCLPGGPASNEMAFIQFALPGILRMFGQANHPLSTVKATLTEDISGRHPKWTEFKDAMLYADKEGNYQVKPYRQKSRLQSIAEANSLICIPEGKQELHRGDYITVQVLIPTFGGLPIPR